MAAASQQVPLPQVSFSFQTMGTTSYPCLFTYHLSNVSMIAELQTASA